MDKRDLSGVFRDRLRVLLLRTGSNQSAFAASIGIDRSALSQILSGAVTRLPRAETLTAIAAEHKVSLDWLLGLSQDEGLTAEIRQSFELEEAPDDLDRTPLSRWHAEAKGTKIRYVPAGIPDLLRSPSLIAYEANYSRRGRATRQESTRSDSETPSLPDADMEVCMPRHTLEVFARGLGIWDGLPAADRQAQLDHMAKMLDDLYPTLRLYLYDGRARYSVPYTIFGTQRAAVYVGDMYLVLNAPEAVKTLTRHFDTLVRAAAVNAHEAASFARDMRKLVTTSKTD